MDNLKTLMRSADKYLVLIIIGIIVIYTVYKYIEPARKIMNCFLYGALSVLVYISFAIKNGGINTYLAVFLFVLVSGVSVFITIKCMHKQHRAIRDEEKQIEENIAFLDKVLNEVNGNIRIMKMSTLPFTAGELARLEEVYRLYDETLENFERREEFEYIAAINFMQDVMCDVYDSARKRWEDMIRNAEEERFREQYEKQQKAPEINRAVQDAHGYFSGCSTKQQLKKRYRELCKIYHPDSASGNEEMFEKIKDEYERIDAGM